MRKHRLAAMHDCSTVCRRGKLLLCKRLRLEDHQFEDIVGRSSSIKPPISRPLVLGGLQPTISVPHRQKASHSNLAVFRSLRAKAPRIAEYPVKKAKPQFQKASKKKQKLALHFALPQTQRPASPVQTSGADKIFRARARRTEQGRSLKAARRQPRGLSNKTVAKQVTSHCRDLIQATLTRYVCTAGSASRGDGGSPHLIRKKMQNSIQNRAIN